jgi:hypothetical protein
MSARRKQLPSVRLCDACFVTPNGKLWHNRRWARAASTSGCLVVEWTLVRPFGKPQSAKSWKKPGSRDQNGPHTHDVHVAKYVWGEFAALPPGAKVCQIQGEETHVLFGVVSSTTKPPAWKGCLVWFQDAPLQARHLRTQQAEVSPTSSDSQRRSSVPPALARCGINRQLRLKEHVCDHHKRFSSPE